MIKVIFMKVLNSDEASKKSRLNMNVNERRVYYIFDKGELECEI